MKEEREANLGQKSGEERLEHSLVVGWFACQVAS